MTEKPFIFDTETTKIPDFKAPYNAPDQVRIVQLAAALCGSDGRIIHSMSAIIKPEGWEIPEDVVKIHGITTEYALEHGMPLTTAIGLFMLLAENSTVRVAHNESFDDFVIKTALRQLADAEDTEEVQRWKSMSKFCTATSTTKILQLPPTDKMMAAGVNTFKRPNLQEAYEYYHGRPFDGAHDALADVVACKDVYFKVQQGAGPYREAA